MAEIFSGEKDPLMGYIIRKPSFIDSKLHGRAIDRDNGSLGISRTLIIDGKSLQSHILTVMKIESQKLCMENKSAVLSPNGQMAAVRQVKGNPFDGVFVMVGNAKRPLKGIIRIKMIGSLFENKFRCFLCIPAFLQNFPEVQHVHPVFFSWVNSIIFYNYCSHIVFSCESFFL